MTIPKEILDAYEKYAKKYGTAKPKFFYGTTPEPGGGVHLEIKSDGRIVAIGINERGVENLREEMESVDELMYWIFRSKANAAAFDTIQDGEYDYEARQKIALDKIGKISDEWRERLRQEQLSYKNES